MKRKQLATELLASAGITLNGPAATDIQVYDERFFDRVFAQGQLGLGEAFMEGWWDVGDLTGFMTKLLSSPIRSSLDKMTVISNFIQAWMSHRQSRSRNKIVATQHYNMDGRVFRIMLDKRYAMYTCGVYRTGAKTPEDAQEAKLELSGRKMVLRPGQEVLDVGSGFTAGLLRYIVQRYDVRGVGVVNSEAQFEQSMDMVRGMPIEIRLQDYRDIEGQFDRICSMGMFEHVGPGHYGIYFRKLSSLLKDDGLMLLHHIGCREPKWRCDA
ncbi:MAG TPA: class I SAM-dependent methyltransferase, partial [Candidatus Paceibacterota bacterium]|nr:class I SAM-dependent methyltransferase [Candidatus Paceibacterota bacterium]